MSFIKDAERHGALLSNLNHRPGGAGITAAGERLPLSRNVLSYALELAFAGEAPFQMPAAFVVTGTKRFVSPIGATPEGYGAYYTEVGAAVNACATGDEVVLQCGVTHTLAAGLIQKNAISVLIRNERNDRNYSDCEVVVANDATLYFRSATDVGMRVYFKGVTFRGASAASPTVYNDNSRNGLIRGTAVYVGMEWVFDHCRFAHMTRTGTHTLYGGIFSFKPDTGSSGNSAKFIGCEFDHLYGEFSGPTYEDGEARRIWQIWDYDVDFYDCWFHDNGDYGGGRVGNGMINSQYLGTMVRFFSCRWDRSWALANQAPDAGADGGAFYCYTNQGSGSTYYPAVAKLWDCVFNDGGAQKGGGYWCGMNGDTYAYRCTFIDCKSKGGPFGGGACGRGGQVDNAYLGRSEFRDCLFLRCTAEDGAGGALRSTQYNAQLVVESCTFVDCTADLAGQAIRVPENGSAFTTATARIRNCVFVGAGEQVYADDTVTKPGLGELRHCWFSSGADSYYAPDATVEGISTGGTFDQIGAPTFALATGLPMPLSRFDVQMRERNWKQPTIGCYD